MRVSWTPVTGADGAKVRASARTNGSATWTTTAWTTSPSASVTGLTNGVMYEFQVRAGTGAAPRVVRQRHGDAAAVGADDVGSSNTCAVTVSGRAYCWGTTTPGSSATAPTASTAWPRSPSTPPRA